MITPINHERRNRLDTANPYLLLICALTPVDTQIRVIH